MCDIKHNPNLSTIDEDIDDDEELTDDGRNEWCHMCNMFTFISTNTPYGTCQCS